jgi:site-specific DNA recombinase
MEAKAIEKQFGGAVLYLRVSIDEQVDNYSLDTQEDICKKEAERRGLIVKEVFREEGRSAKTITGRPALLEMLTFCRKHKREVSAVIVYRLDRISRQTADYLSIRKKLAECEIKLISASEPTGSSPTEKFIETMLASFAQMDNDVRSERTKNGMKARFLSGLKNGNVPLGYLNKDGYAVKDPEAWDKMTESWELIATGTKTLKQMIDFMDGLELRAGKKKHVLCKQTLDKIFRNKFYAGKVVSREYGQEVLGQHPAMVTEALFYRVQAVLDGRCTQPKALTRRSQDNPKFPLRRVVRCKKCGSSFTGAWSKGKRKRYAYYFCSKRCGAPSVPVDTLETEAASFIATLSLKPKTIELILSELRKVYSQRVKVVQKKREQADEELQKLYGFRQALIEKNISGVYSDEVFKEQNRIVEDKIKAVFEAKDDELIEKFNLEAISEFIKNKFGDLAKTYQDSNLDQLKILLCSIFPSGLVWDYRNYSNTEISPFYQAFLGVQNNGVNYGAPEGIRTPDLWYRKPTLYPTELRAHGASDGN